MNAARPSGRLRVAACQMVSGTRVDQNLATAARLIAQAAAAGAQLVALPEYFCLMGRRDEDKVEIREAAGAGPLQDFLAAQALRHGVWLAGGTIPLAAPAPGRVLNTSLVFDPQGRCVARYDKIHLFAFSRGAERYDEARTIVPGQAPGSFEIPLATGGQVRVGLSVCYDLRFPELYRALGAPDLVLVPAAFTATTGQAHWTTLLRARAIENLCYVLAPAQGGVHENGRATYGHSCLIEPWGEVQSELASGEGVVAGEVDLARIADLRASLPALDHRVL
jgi:nitrilase